MIRGWCPSALRPMQSGDGLIVRLKLTGGVLGVALAQQIAGMSSQWGNGLIDLSGRANLQLRGVSDGDLPALHDRLAELGLLGGSEGGEAVRNVIASPLAGVDPSAVLDVRPVVVRLEQRLAGDVSLHGLPGKFGFAVDDGGMLGLDDVPADVRFVACRTGDGPAFAVHLPGAALGFGPCRPEAVSDVAAALGRAFLRLREPPVRRMRGLVAACGAETIAREAGLGQPFGGSTERRAAFLGVQAGFVGVGLPFGRIGADDLAFLVSAAAEMGAQDLRLTPWRAILVPVPSLEAARALSDRLVGGAFILDDRDPRLRVAACPGAPSCERATTPVRDDADVLATGVAGDFLIHVSGCAKGCAHPRAAAVTLVGRNGRYDLVRNGAASDAPVVRGLTVAQAIERARGVAA